ncbi:MAG: hypothetical protein KFF68_07750 [Desulfosarcina sp.]|nr:hypothetical protein [Desulfosarcina sp.]
MISDKGRSMILKERLEARQGDITQSAVDAMVNAANCARHMDLMGIPLRRISDGTAVIISLVDTDWNWD